MSTLTVTATHRHQLESWFKLAPKAKFWFEEFKPLRASWELSAAGLISRTEESYWYSIMEEILVPQIPVLAVPVERASAASTALQRACAGAALGGSGPTKEQLAEYSACFQVG